MGENATASLQRGGQLALPLWARFVPLNAIVCCPSLATASQAAHRLPAKPVVLVWRQPRAWRETGHATRWAIRGLVSRVAEGNERVERVPTEPQRCPAVALVAALPEPTVGKAGEQAAIGGEERVGHRR